MKARTRTASSISTAASSCSLNTSAIASFDVAPVAVGVVSSEIVKTLPQPCMMMTQVLVVNPDGVQMWIPLLMPAVAQPFSVSARSLKEHAAVLQQQAKKARAAARAARKAACALRRCLEAKEKREKSKRVALRRAQRVGQLSQDSADSDDTESTSSGSDADLSSCFEDDGLASEFEDQELVEGNVFQGCHGGLSCSDATVLTT